MKKILLTLIIGIGVAGIANATLWDFYNGNLPSVSDRASEATECDISDYTGTYDQNIKLENCLREKAFLGATTSTAPTPAPSLYRNQTWTGVNTYTSSTISSGNNTWTGTNTFNGTTTLGTTTVNNLISNGLNQYFTAGENITAGQPLIIGLSSTTLRSVDLGGSQDDYLTFNNGSTVRYGQSFTTPATGVDGKYVSTYQLDSVNINGSEGGLGSFSGTFTVDIYLADSNDLPTGSVLYTTTTGSISSDTFSGLGVSFTNAYLNPNTKYVATFTASAGDGSVYFRFNTANNNPYSGGKVISSSNSGSSWASYSTGNFDMNATFRYYEDEMTTGSVYTAKAGTANVNFYKNFIGFAYNNAVTSSQVLVTTNGIISGLSGLNTGRTYYIGSTFGSVTSTDPTNSAKVGLAVSSTQILIKHDNP
jgi:hypothetical protein